MPEDNSDQADIQLNNTGTVENLDAQKETLLKAFEAQMAQLNNAPKPESVSQEPAKSEQPAVSEPEITTKAPAQAFSLARSDQGVTSDTIERECYKDVYKLVNGTKEAVLFEGPAGSGKTRLTAIIADKKNLNYTRLRVDNSVSLSEWCATTVLETDQNGTKTRTVTGKLVDAVTKPGIVCIDETSRCDANKMSLLNELLDSGKFYVRNHGWVEKHPECRIFLTMNPHDGKYSGTFKPDASTISRMVCISIPQFTEEELRRLIPENKYKETLISFYLKTHEAMIREELDFDFSIRNISYIVQAVQMGLPLRKALDIGLLNAIAITGDKDQRELILNIAVAEFGPEIVGEVAEKKEEVPA